MICLSKVRIVFKPKYHSRGALFCSQPPESGNFSLFLNCDDQCRVWLKSLDNVPDVKRHHNENVVFDVDTPTGERDRDR